VSAAREPMGELQALVTGAIIGALMKASADPNLSPEGGPFLIRVEPRADAQGYLPELLVTGRESGERVIVRVTALEPAE
jgi:hypothetical protein